MKKILSIVVLSFLFCNVAISKHLCGDSPFKDFEGVSCIDSKDTYNEHTCICEPTPTLKEKFRDHFVQIVFISISLIVVFLFIKFRVKTIKLIKLLFKKIKSPFKNDLKRVMLSLSILYLCIMYYLNWLGHQSAFFIYKMTYSWFIRWALIPVVAGWIFYFIWKKK